MRRAILLLAALLGGCAGHVALPAQTPFSDVPAAPPGYRPAFVDEFDGTIIDRAKWGFDVDCWGGGNHERQCYTDRARNASVANGVLTITARREATTGTPLNMGEQAAHKGPLPMVTKDYSSARMVTRGHAAWRYGRVAVRARLPQGQGAWPAIWMLPEDWAYGPWAASGEIDIMEAVNLGTPCADCADGREDHILGTIHFGGQPPRNKYLSTETHRPDVRDGGFHVFAVDWTPAHILWTIDGTPYAERRASEWSTTATDRPGAPFDKPFHLLLNLAVGGGLAEGRNLKTVDDRAMPWKFDIDWVRVWQCAPDPASADCA